MDGKVKAYRPVPHEEFLASLPAHEQAAIARRMKEIGEEELTLRQLRKAMRITQTRLAKKLKITQDGVSKLENRSDLLLSTLQDYVEAMGGTLTLVATLPGLRRVTLTGFADLRQTKRALRAKQPAKRKANAKTRKPHPSGTMRFAAE